LHAPVSFDSTSSFAAAVPIGLGEHRLAIVNRERDVMPADEA
jgi:hypothetical protein